MKQNFGKTKNGEQAQLFTIRNNKGMEARVTDYGATLVSLIVPNVKGEPGDVVQGFDNVSGYEESTYYMGATIGRHAGQVRNACFTLNGESYHLVVNDMDNTMHGGPEGFHSRMFRVESHADNSLILTYTSRDGEAGFPGNLEVTVTYRLSDDDELEINFDAHCDRDTVLSMTNHSYFNLNGHDAPSILDHQLEINAHEYMEVDKQCVPNGKILRVEGTPFDFLDFHEIGERVNEEVEQLRVCTGYDHNWVISSDNDGAMRLCCELKSQSGQRHMQVFSNRPGLQMYSGNYLDGKFAGKGGNRYLRQSALCLEPQVCPDSLTHHHFPSAVLKAGEQYGYRSVYRFVPYFL